MKKRITRRQFSATLAATGALAATKLPTMGALGANERVRLGIIGVGNRGDQLIASFMVYPDAQIDAICDVYTPYLEFAKKKTGGNPYTTKDYRNLLDRKDLDAIIIATPDHWHALQFIDACRACKDIYVEKPLSLVIEEGRRMVQAAKRHNVITQVGTHRRSWPVAAEVPRLIQDGAIGKVTECQCFCLTNETPMGIGNPPDSHPPKGLDWDLWLGPAPKVPYNANRCLYKFRWFRAYSGGQLTNFGTHFLDEIQWAIGQDAPKGVFAIGNSIGVQDNRDIPVNMKAIWDYPDGTLVTYVQSNANASTGNKKDAYIEFRGTEGTLFQRSGSLEIVPESVRTKPCPALDPTRRAEVHQQYLATRKAREPYSSTGEASSRVTPLHARNFLDCVKSRKPCNAPVEVGHRSTSTTLMANIAYDRKRYLAWDAEKERFTNDPQANKLLSYEYRPPWKLP